MFVDSIQNMKIICDDREPKTVNALAKSAGLELVRKRLLTGDYILGDICIERKTIDDFCSSIMDGRLDRQMENMKRDFKHYYILISGSIDKRTSAIGSNCILGKMASILVKHQVPILMVDNDRQLMYAMRKIFERHSELNQKTDNE